MCDDGNRNNGDGCSSSCTIENNYYCTHNAPGAADTCSNYCGDGKVNFTVTNEDCDDGNRNNGDGCDNTCKVESLWQCSVTPPSTSSACVKICGNGVKSGSEACDDNNTVSNDGCSDLCVIESGYECSVTPPATKSVCTIKCPNGKYQTGNDSQNIPYNE